MYYSGVTLGLLHGCMPDYIILTHEPNREIDVANHPIPLLNDLIELYIKLMNPFKKTTFLGINLLTLKLDHNQSQMAKAINKRMPGGKSVPTKYEDMYPFLSPNEIQENML